MLETMVSLLKEVNWKLVCMSGLGNLVCLQVTPVVCRVVWRDYIEEYDRLGDQDKMDFNMRYTEATYGVVSASLAAVVRWDARVGGSRMLIGSTSLGNALLSITIGQFISDLVYCIGICRCKPSRLQLLHHVAVIFGALLAHRYFHTFALYRYIQFFTLPLSGIFTQMKKLKVDRMSLMFRGVETANLFVFTSLRFVAILPYWLWMIQTSLNAPDKMDVPLLMWVVTILSHIIVDIGNMYWSSRFIWKYLKR